MAADRVESAALGVAARHPATCRFVGSCFAPGLTPLIVSVSIGMGFHTLHEMGYSISIFLLFVTLQQLSTVINTVSAGIYVASTFGGAHRFEMLDRMLGRAHALDSVVGARGMTKFWMVVRARGPNLLLHLPGGMPHTSLINIVSCRFRSHTSAHSHDLLTSWLAMLTLLRCSSRTRASCSWKR